MKEFVAARWSEMGAKIVQLAEAVPEERFDFRPTEDVRSFAEQVRHVAFWNLYLLQTLRGQEADAEANELPRDEYPSKVAAVAVLRDSFQGVAAEMASAGDGDAAAKAVLPFVEHGAEHYGQLVVYCRLNGVVPPASRG